MASVSSALGSPFMPWQTRLANQALECDDRGRLVYGEVRVTVPRQSGKSTLVFAKNLQRMIDAAHFGGPQRLTYTAQTRMKAREKLVDDWMGTLKLRRRFNGRWKPRLSIGNEAIIWENGSIFGIESTKAEAGHGSTLDSGDIDEAFSRKDSANEQAMSPAMVTRMWSQLWVISTAGDEKSIYLKDKVDSGRKMAEAGLDRDILYVEYCAEDNDVDPEDVEVWYSCMPALGYTTTEEKIRQELLKMGPAGFKRAYLNLWLPSNYLEQPIPEADWAAIRDPSSQIEGDWLVWGIDVSPGSATAAIAVAGPRADSATHAEVMDYREGDGWVIDRLLELQSRWGRRPVVLDPAGPAGGLVAGLVRAGFTPRSTSDPDGLLVTTSARQLTQACSTMTGGAARQAGADLLADPGSKEETDQPAPDRRWRHRGQNVLDDALKAAGKRELAGAWAWDRRSSMADICPLVAVTLALHGCWTIDPPKDDMPLVAWV